MTETLYPWGYQRAFVSLARLKELARFDLMEHETAERAEAWLVSRNGEVGIGGAVRFVQPDRPGFAPDGESFHQIQTFVDGGKAFAALDVVVRNGADVHRAPRWNEVPQQGTKHADITDYGVHANVNGEPWHIQPIEIDGHATWVKNGRPRPNGNFPIKNVTPTPPPTPTPAPTPTQPNPNDIVPGSRTLRLASPTMRGADVIWVQNVLLGQGLSVSVDGYYGLQTVTRVKIMQGWNGLTQDGVCGPKTFEVLKKY